MNIEDRKKTRIKKIITSLYIKNFEKFIDKTDYCWNWTGAINLNGYGHLTLINGSARAHRVSYEIYVGEIPSGLVIDHLCSNRKCVNPAHLEPVTQEENMRRAWKNRRIRKNNIKQT